MNKKTKGLVVAGLGGGSGKSVVAVGLTAALKKEGYLLAPFKKGPDYIDANWLGQAAKNVCYNLDPYLMDQDALKKSFYTHARNSDIAIIEGNRGLYDGVDASGSYSTAELAIMLDLPVFLVVDCTKTTRTIAALVLGCMNLDPKVNIAGVILNRIGSDRHEAIIRQAIEQYAGVPVVGAFRRQKKDIFPMRHLGVTPVQEYDGVREAIIKLGELAFSSLDIEAIKKSMCCVHNSDNITEEEKKREHLPSVKIGIIRDVAFQFYYPENLQALRQEGAELVEIDAIHSKELPEIDGLYIGGGFPETSARYLSANTSFMTSIKKKAQKGMPIYAECGGLIYLGDSITLEEEVFPLVGIFPVHFTLSKKPQAHGYSILKAESGNPYYSKGTVIKGHEFRYSKVEKWSGKTSDLTLSMERGVGFAQEKDGLTYKNVMALYSHIHAVGTPEWAPALVHNATEYKRNAKNKG